MDALLADHAYCELKAASTALSFIVRFAERPALADAMTDLAREEMKHFDRVHALLRERGRALPRIQGDAYAKRLRELGGPSLLEALVAGAFIEARSCERFRLLAAAPIPEPLRSFYRELAAAEERHHELFLSLAAEEAGADKVRQRVAEVAQFEAQIVRKLPLGPRIH